MRPTRRPAQCSTCGGRVKLNGERWWCWACDSEVASRPRSAPKLARTRLRPLGPAERRARVSTRHYGDEERRAWLHGLPCVEAGCPGHVCGPWDMDLGRAVIQAVHVRARGAGGGADDQVPGCAVMHRESGEYGTSQRCAWEARTGIDLVARAAEYAAGWAAVVELRAESC